MKYNLIIFDLDYTLWDCGNFVDLTVPPYYKKDGLCYDSEGTCLKLYDDVIDILETLKKDGYIIGVASRTYAPDYAIKLMNLHDINKYFTYREIFPADKIAHFQNLKKDTGIPYEEMIFFDDEPRNVDDVGSLGVTSILVENGINKELLNLYL